MQDDRSSRIPLVILTGFLGSGKTTLLNRLLQSAGMDETAILINEFGAVGIDHLIVRALDDDVVLLNSGCVCCSIRDDFTQTLLELEEKRRKKLVPPFKQVILETTGIADPAAILQLLMRDTEICEIFRASLILTVVDCVYGRDNLNRHVEATYQVAVADRIILSKMDLADTTSIHQIKQLIRRINSNAPVINTDKVTPEMLFQSHPGRPVSWTDKQRYLKTMRQDQVDCDSHHFRDRFSSFSLLWPEPVDWNDIVDWLDGLLYARGHDILRVKGLLHINGKNAPVVVQGVQHSLYQPQTLPGWSGNNPESTLVFIVCNFSKQAAITSMKPYLNVKVV